MDSQELQGWEIAKERVADFARETGQNRLASSFAAPRQAHPAQQVAPALLKAVFTVVSIVLHVIRLGQ